VCLDRVCVYDVPCKDVAYVNDILKETMSPHKAGSSFLSMHLMISSCTSL
jgi:hypothetical protein